MAFLEFEIIKESKQGDVDKDKKELFPAFHLIWIRRVAFTYLWISNNLTNKEAKSSYYIKPDMSIFNETLLCL